MGMFWGVIFSSGVPKQLAPNDGTDSQALPLEELPVPPSEFPESILRAWQPQLTVTILRPPGGGSPPDNPPIRQAFGAQEAVQQRAWQITWPAQSAIDSLSWEGRLPPPPLPQPTALWPKATWGAQSAIDSTAWDPGTTPPLPKPLQPVWPNTTWGAQRAPVSAAWDSGTMPPAQPPQQVVWRNPVWSAQRAIASTAWDAPALPPFVAQPPTILAAWQTNYRVTVLGPLGGGSVASDNPPLVPRAQPDWNAWQRRWYAQSAAPNAGWNFTAATVDNPPPAKAYPEQVFRAWQPGLRVTLLEPPGGPDFLTPDNPPPPQAYPPHIFRAWQPEVRITLLNPTGGESVAAGPVDNPPFGYRRPDTSARWYATWKSLDVQLPAGPTQLPDDPPPYQSYGVAQTLLKWQVRWPAQGPGQTAAWNFVPPVIDNPPVRNQYSAAQIVARQWQQNWLAQSRNPIGWIFPEPPVVVPPTPQFDTGSRSGSGGGEPVKKKKNPTPLPIQRRAGAKNTYVSLDSGQIYDQPAKAAAPKTQSAKAPGVDIAEAEANMEVDPLEAQEAAEILAMLDKFFK